MRCKTTPTEKEVLQTSASCGRSFHLQRLKGTGFCVIWVVPSIGLGWKYEMFQWHLFWHTTACAKGVAEPEALQLIQTRFASLCRALCWADSYGSDNKKLFL